MSIPLDWFLERLSRTFPLRWEKNSNRHIVGIRLLLMHNVNAQADILYIGNLSEKDEDKFDGCMVLSKGETRSGLFSVCLENSAVSYEVLFNRCLAIAEEFLHMEREVTRILYDPDGLQKFIDFCSRVLQNPTHIADANFKVVAIDKTPMFSEISAIWRHLILYGYLSYDILIKLKSSGDLDKMNAYKHAVILHSSTFNNEYISYNLSVDGRIYGHFYAVGYNKKITPGDVSLAEYLGKLLQETRLIDRHFSFLQRRDYENFLGYLLRGAIHDQILIQKQLEPLGWKIEGKYCVVQFVTFHLDEISLEYLINKLEKIHGGKPVRYEKALVVVFALQTDNQADQIEAPVIQFAVSNNLQAGISDVFDGLQRLPLYYEQTQIALSYQKKEPDRHVFFFRDYAILHLLKNCDTYIKLSTICEKSIFNIRDYDREHHTEYLLTLKLYLHNERSLALTAEALDIHRNTLLYRIHRLEEKYNLNLGDASSRERILFSLYILQVLDEKAAGAAQRTSPS